MHVYRSKILKLQTVKIGTSFILDGSRSFFQTMYENWSKYYYEKNMFLFDFFRVQNTKETIKDPKQTIVSVF